MNHTRTWIRYPLLPHGSQKAEEPTRDLIKDPHIIATMTIWSAATYYLLK